MKKCPACNRTYADDGFTFCLEDGALLSAPYDVSKQDQLASTIQTGPPPTLALPIPETAGQPMPATVSAQPHTDVNDHNQKRASQPRRTAGSRKTIVGLAALLLLVSTITFSGFYFVSKARCPKIVIRCSPETTSTYCELSEDRAQVLANPEDKPIGHALTSRSVILFQAPALPSSITNVSWTASAGAIRTNHSQLVVDTTGLAGKTITVQATITSSSWGCSTTLSNSFRVPSAQPTSVEPTQ